jgi:Uri superfamily endonuclease
MIAGRFLELVRPFPGFGETLGPGCYSLIIKLRCTKTLRVGQLGAAVLPRGTYVYTGSAMNGLTARLRRHLSRDKKLHWHIDYLLALREARIERIIVYPPARDQECRQNQRISRQPGATAIVKNFGAADCHSDCPSHLYYFA